MKDEVMPRVLFIADQFADVTRTAWERYPGGAELTDEAAFAACPWPLECALTDEVDPRRLAEFDVHIIGNCERPSAALVQELMRLGRHVLFEHDLRLCQWRGNFPAASEYTHRYMHRCICPILHLAPLIETARGTIFLTTAQRERYLRNPFFVDGPSSVLGSSLMSESFVDRVRNREKDALERDLDTVVVFSRQQNKGYEQAMRYCLDRNIEPYVIRDLTPAQVLDVFERARTLVYLPTGPEPAGRLPLEARFLGCNVVANDLVGVCREPWWRLPDHEAFPMVADGPARFWRLVEDLLEGGHEQAGAPASRTGLRVTRPFNLGLTVVQRALFSGPIIKRLGQAAMSKALEPRLMWDAQI
ncbi:MAG: hypothetical protein ACNA8W_14315 [Bradymonadaceae bacterium]